MKAKPVKLDEISERAVKKMGEIKKRNVSASFSSELLSELLAALECMVESHGYTSYISDDEKESEEDVIASREAIAKAKKYLTDT